MPAGVEGIEVRWATDEDIPEIFSLIKELAEFEKALDCVKTTEAQLASDLRAKHFVAVVATVPVSPSRRTVGFALLHTRYSTWLVALSLLLLFSLLPSADLSLSLLLHQLTTAIEGRACASTWKIFTSSRSTGRRELGPFSSSAA